MNKQEKNTVTIIVAIIICFILVVAFVTINNLFFYHGCGGDTVDMELYTAHEWGIFRQEYASHNVTYSSGPQPGIVPMPEVVEQIDCKPVIYFHGEGLMDLEINIDMKAREIRTIPLAYVSEDTLNWKIQVAGEIYDDETEAQVVDENGDVFEYLFYEGISEYYQNILLNLTLNMSGDLHVSIQNIGEFAINDCLLITEIVNGTSSEISAIHFDYMLKDQITSKTVKEDEKLETDQIRDHVKDLILRRDLTENETEDLLEYWIDKETDENGIKAETSLIEPKGYNNAQFVFFITEEEYNEMLPIEFSKDPSSLRRVGIIHISEIPINVV